MSNEEGGQISNSIYIVLQSSVNLSSQTNYKTFTAFMLMGHCLFQPVQAFPFVPFNQSRPWAQVA